MNKIFIVEPAEEQKRLDVFIAEKLNITRAKAQEIIEKECVLVNNSIKSKSYKLKLNEKIEILNFILSKGSTIELKPQNIPTEIIYKDEYLLVVAKPPGMVVYPAAGHQDGTLMNALAYHVKKLASVGGPLRPGVVHRLDKDTSGLIVVSLDDKAYYKLVEIFKKREILKEYLTIVYGKLEGKGKITLSIGRSETNRKKMSTKSKKGKEAITEWEAIKNFNNYTLLKVRILTGRTHQIRVHFSSIGHPILGDKTYGKKVYIEIGKRKIPIPRQMLHAFRIKFKHPITDTICEFEAPLPEDMVKILNLLDQNYD